ncbi:MAG: hypothetical protein KAX45_00030 [Chitinophagaceae bacterium]|nr:hypothetical protein [Chitinophagaceae bacterium]MBP6588608.1 hypothetical protein [Chitinophagaceae bacterium]MBP8242895.1 hypothetical protein [Chitinophagaceae bacterium]
MKLISITALFFLSLSFSCKKEKKENCESYLEITKVSISPASNVTNSIIFNLDAYGPNLCYSFKQLNISKTGDKSYDIKVIAGVPCKPTVCAQALYQINPTGTISAVTAGTYTLRFYNGSSLFTQLTVTI